MYGPSILLAFYGDVRPGPSSVFMLRLWLVHLLGPIVLVALISEHVHLLHLDTSTQGLFDEDESRVKVYGCVLWLDVLGVLLWTMLWTCAMSAVSDITWDDEHCRIANLYATPMLRPEWYFLPYYGLLRATPSTTLGLLLSITLFCYPLLDAHSTLRESTYAERILHALLYLWIYVIRHVAPISPLYTVWYMCWDVMNYCTSYMLGC